MHETFQHGQDGCMPFGIEFDFSLESTFKGYSWCHFHSPVQLTVQELQASLRALVQFKGVETKSNKQQQQQY